jgi:murein DD-endopeptidase MepM/ murein hydrolase activator NlpD
VGVKRAVGRAGGGLLGGVVAAALLLSGVPVATAATPTPTAGFAGSTGSASSTATPSINPDPSGTATATGKAEAKKAAARKRAAKEAAARAKAAAAKQRAQEAARERAAEAARKAAAAKKAAEQALEDAHDAAALIAATQALQAAQVELTTARQALTTARDELQVAKAVDLRAHSDLNAAVFAEQRATRELSSVQTRIVSHATDLGQLARASYQSGGSLGELSFALASETPTELADRLATMQSVASAGNAVIAKLQQDRADLLNSQSRLTAAREEQQTLAEKARLALADKAVKEVTARSAEQHVTVVVKAREAALVAARKAAVEDRAQYQTMLVQSGALGTRIRDLAANLASGKRPPQGTGVFDRPGRGAVTSPYGPRMHPILHYVKIHTGTDFAAADGIVYAADDGVVLLTEGNVAYGNMTVIDHGTLGGKHVTTLYAHQAAFGVQPGDRVSKGQPIGVIGSTGYATGPHLHFEVRIDGSPLDPGPFLVNAPLPPAPGDALGRAQSVS